MAGRRLKHDTWLSRSDTGGCDRGPAHSADDQFVSDRNSFFRAASTVALAAQVLALLPVYGITGANAHALRFRWLSARTFYSVSMAAGYGVIFCLHGNKFFTTTPFTFSSAAQVLFFLNACGVNLMFLRLAPRWPHILRQWEAVELQMRGYGFPRALSRKVAAITTVILSLATLEHLCSNVSKVRRGLLCSQDGSDFVRAYFVNNYYVFSLTYYAPWKALLILHVNLVATFTWTYADLFLITVSTALADRFRQVNLFLRSVRGKSLSQELWGKVRRDYDQVSRLTVILCSCVSHLVLLSFLANMYFICLQLNYSLSFDGSMYEATYFYSSLMFIAFRAYAVLFCMASVHEESKQPRKILQWVPSRSYCPEVDRFLFQVTFQEVTFTGLRLFSVNRKFILTVLSAVITYQIVLIQMTASSTYEYSIPSKFNFTIDCMQ